MTTTVAELSELVREIMSGQPAGSAAERFAWLWRTLSEAGLTLVGVADERGGSGGSVRDLVTVVTASAERGAVLPITEVAAANRAITDSGFGPIDRVTVAWLPPGLRIDALSGAVVDVLWADWATHVVVASDSGEDGDLALIDLADAEVMSFGEEINGVPRARVILPEVDAAVQLPGSSVHRILALMGLLRSAEIVGAARGAYQLTKRYVRDRQQFGRPLVRIPAVASALAMIKVQVTQAEAALEHAVERGGPPHGLRSTAIARVVCGSAATEIAKTAHQLHGAMGITAEYPLHRFTRTLWTARDADLAEYRWAEILGDAAVLLGEEMVWAELTAVDGDIGEV